MKVYLLMSEDNDVPSNDHVRAVFADRALADTESERMEAWDRAHPYPGGGALCDAWVESHPYRAPGQGRWFVEEYDVLTAAPDGRPVSFDSARESRPVRPANSNGLVQTALEDFQKGVIEALTENNNGAIVKRILKEWP